MVVDNGKDMITQIADIAQTLQVNWLNMVDMLEMMVNASSQLYQEVLDSKD
jgi:predicted DNA-binding protein with PD1-like motif